MAKTRTKIDNGKGSDEPTDDINVDDDDIDMEEGGYDGKNADGVNPLRVCSHVNWSHSNDMNDFDGARCYLSLCMDKDSAKELTEELYEESMAGDIEHYRASDILRASKLPCLPDTDPEVARHIDGSKKGVKHSPVLLIRGEDGKKPAIIADGYHRVCSALYLTPEDQIPCVVVRRC